VSAASLRSSRFGSSFSPGFAAQEEPERVATIVFGTHMVGYPLGGALSSKLQWIVGFHRLGHQVYVVEKSAGANTCYDPVRKVTSDDCSHGVAVMGDLLGRFGLAQNWCFVDAAGKYHGMSQRRARDVFAAADVYFDYGAHGLWREEAASAGTRVFIDGEPGYRQMKMTMCQADAADINQYDHYFTVGRNIGTPGNGIPTARRRWKHTWSPVVIDLFRDVPPPAPDAPFTTIMNWQSHKPLECAGTTYGQKDAEFPKFIALPGRVDVPMEVAVSGSVPADQLRRCGWQVTRAQAATITYDSFGQYIARSMGEFSVCKNVFVATDSGWFSDRSAAYLAAGRPVVMQETGFSRHLPCGAGLFAVNTLDEAVDAINAIRADYAHHAAAGRDIARAYLDASVVLPRLLRDAGV
jgi:hypothetical protein